MHELFLAEQSSRLQRRELSSIELTKHYLARIERLNPSLNAILTVDADGALQAAAEADKQLAAGNTGPLTGIPLVHKDIFCTTGVKTTCGSRMLENYVSPFDATVVARLKSAGTVMLGKANMDEFAMGSSNENSFFWPGGKPLAA